MMQAQISVGNRPAAAAGTRLGTYGDLGSFRTALGTFSGRSRAAWGYGALGLGALFSSPVAFLERAHARVMARINKLRRRRLLSCSSSLGPLLLATALAKAKAVRLQGSVRLTAGGACKGKRRRAVSHPLKLLGHFAEYRPAHGTVALLPLTSKRFTRHEAITYDDADVYHDALNFGWSAPVHVFLLCDSDSMDAALTRAALATAASGPGLRVSNRGGFHSSRTWLQDLADTCKHADVAHAARQLLRAISEAIQLAEGVANSRVAPMSRAPTDSWCNVVGVGNYHGLHDHEGAAWSGVYYTAVPPSVTGSSGALVLRTATSMMTRSHDMPHSGKRSMDGDWCSYAALTPQPGALVLFLSRHQYEFA